MVFRLNPGLPWGTLGWYNTVQHVVPAAVMQTGMVQVPFFENLCTQENNKHHTGDSALSPTPH